MPDLNWERGPRTEYGTSRTFPEHYTGWRDGKHVASIVSRSGFFTLHRRLLKGDGASAGWIYSDEICGKMLLFESPEAARVAAMEWLWPDEVPHA